MRAAGRLGAELRHAAKDSECEWRTIAPWAYNHVSVSQLPWASPTVEVLPDPTHTSGGLRVLLSAPEPPVQGAGGAHPAASAASAAAAASELGDQEPAGHALVCGAIRLAQRGGQGQSAQAEAAQGELELSGASSVGANPVLVARAVRASPLRSLVAVKCTDRLAICDLGAVSSCAPQCVQVFVPLPSKRPRQVARKSRGLGCQPGSAVIAFSDHSNPAAAGPTARSEAYLWDACSGQPVTRAFAAAEGAALEELSWVGQHTIIAAQDNGYVLVCDVRDPSAGRRASLELVSRDQEMRCCAAPHPDRVDASPGVVCGGGAEGMHIWDCRQGSGPHGSGGPLAVLPHARQTVSLCSFCPADEATVATATADGRIWIWDLLLMGCAPTPALRGLSERPIPSELAFVHSGHCPSRVNDLAWAQPAGRGGPHVVSVDSAERLHCWSPIVLSARQAAAQSSGAA
eukprot:TRINITY_DN33579_c0_g1_i1.p1 TRINITY_DN33579_c0_g1~~TRINITY_DN33579_c0_g1_i1.p1  ORF type:complete len:459 (+),score=98.59 TRINITY_DN33579_c0_g1_i1:74-1450(+)